MFVDEDRAIDAEVVVAGAGLSGLVAAHDLKTAGRSVAIVEARDRVGGRLLNYPLGDGKWAELGGEYFGDRSTQIAGLAASMGVRGFPTFDDGEKLTYINGRLIRFSGYIPPLSKPALLDFGLAARRLERMAKTIPDNPWEAARAEEWDRETLWSWSRRNMYTKGGRAVMNLCSECVLCAPAAELSLLHLLWYAKTSGGFEYAAAVRGGAQQYRFEGGAQGIAKRLAAGLTDELHLGAAVRRVEQRADSVVVHGDCFSATCRRLIMAIPVSLAGRIVYEPSLPGYRDQLMQRMPPGSAMKCLAVYDTPFWREDGLTGQATSHAGTAVRLTFDTSPPDGRPGVLSAFIVGASARAFARRDPAERRAVVLDECARFFGPQARTPREFVEQNWMAEPFTRGCYHGFTSPGVYTSYGPALRAPIERIHWAGSEAGVHAMGSMGGAVDAGRRAARDVIEALSESASPTREPAGSTTTG